MDNLNPATVEMPNFKLAKVGKDRERKRGGAGWLNGGRGAGSGFSGAAGGAGSGAGGLFGLGASATKAILMLTVSAVVSSGAWQYGKMVAGRGDARAKGDAGKVFADKGGPQKYDDLSGVIKDENSIPNSLGYISGSTDGLTPEERAKKAAEAEAARKADEEAARKAAEDAKKEPATPAAAPADANAIAESAMPKKGLTAGKFGQLGSSFGGGGGLSGGSGLSGGINRNFGAASNIGNKPQGGALSSFRNATKAASASAPHALASKSKSKGFAKRQLDNAFTQSRQATSAGKGETAASSASTPFDNNPGVGNVIAGPGVGNNTGAGNHDNGGMNPTDTGGPLGGGNGAACQSGYAPDINGNCQQIANTNGKKEAPWQSLIDIAEKLIMLVAILALLKLVLEKLPPWGTAIAAYLGYAILGLGLIILGMGVAVMAEGGPLWQGGIIAAIGGFITYMAWPNSAALSTSQGIIWAGNDVAAPAVESFGTSNAELMTMLA